jgi:hypothetical protein
VHQAESWGRRGLWHLPTVLTWHPFFARPCSRCWGWRHRGLRSRWLNPEEAGVTGAPVILSQAAAKMVTGNEWGLWSCRFQGHSAPNSVLEKQVDSRWTKGLSADLDGRLAVLGAQCVLDSGVCCQPLRMPEAQGPMSVCTRTCTRGVSHP